MNNIYKNSMSLKLILVSLNSIIKSKFIYIWIKYFSSKTIKNTNDISIQKPNCFYVHFHFGFLAYDYLDDDGGDDDDGDYGGDDDLYSLFR